jgi:hypothetical protein
MPSSVILDFTYFPGENRLDIVFTSGRRYSYYGVPEEVAQEMAKSFSKGEFFNSQIRNHYYFRRHPDEREAKKA